MRTHRSRPFSILLIVLLGCNADPGNSAAQQKPSALQTRDTAYERRLAEWLRDSTVLDSLAQLVRTDSLYRLYRRAIEPSGASMALVQEVWCEELRLSLKFGTIPADRAVDRLLDTVYRDRGVRDGFAYFAARAPAHGLIESSNCGRLSKEAPSALGRTRLDRVLPARPTRIPRP